MLEFWWLVPVAVLALFILIVMLVPKQIPPDQALPHLRSYFGIEVKEELRKDGAYKTGKAIMRLLHGVPEYDAYWLLGIARTYTDLNEWPPSFDNDFKKKIEDKINAVAPKIYAIK